MYSNLERYSLDKFIGYKITKYENFIIPISLYFQSIKPIEILEIIKNKKALVKLSKQEKVVYNIEQQIMGMKKISKELKTISSIGSIPVSPVYQLLSNLFLCLK